MLITLIQERDGKVEARALEPEWQRLEEWQGVPFRGISYSALLEAGPAQVEEETLLSICLVSAPEAS
jgi:hypothetical protein